MSKLIPAILAATVLIAGIFAFMPIDKASTVHSTINTNSNQQDRWVSGNVLDFVTPANNTNINISDDVTDGLDVSGGSLFVDITDTGADGRVVLYCDEDNSGTRQAGEAVATGEADGVVAVPAFANCDFLRINLIDLTTAGDQADISYVVQFDRSSGN